ncbi:excalibur calcium-binding domain-containing protein [Amycolatopsis endophytica]|uniref:Endonuclease YncB(Thermonuclease family) n=1 Tax=Amycolatopsis endophytica TaxID=860233 RepID=A0A853B0L8_9PSEU|nr:excalibur calcium-binding domain-containing protein [Amycolatopsis endophytica]NYI88266.1 endonuclease YncB(thermonuclease family) [Amycolatopsis endophytica]
MPDASAAPQRRVPTWIKVALAVFAVLFVLGALFGRSSEKPVAQPQPAPPATTAAATTTPADPVYRVARVDGDVVVLSDTAGISKTVYVPGIQLATDCYGTETATWAANFLTGHEVTLQSVAEQTGRTLAHVVLTDGTDYAVAALQGGYARFAAGTVTDAYAASLRTAEGAASAAKAGLWGPPCNGSPTTPPVAPPPVTVAPPPASTPKPVTTKPATTQPTEDEDTGTTSAYYPNCAAAKAAGAAPLHRGDPGYRSGLDRDNDGVACE